MKTKYCNSKSLKESLSSQFQVTIQLTFQLFLNFEISKHTICKLKKLYLKFIPSKYIEYYGLYQVKYGKFTCKDCLPKFKLKLIER
jgi:hypothetical protein